jgi:hypothetical protein
MIRNCNVARLDRNPLQGAGSTQPLLGPGMPGAPILFDGGTTMDRTLANVSDRELRWADDIGIVFGGSQYGTRIVDGFSKVASSHHVSKSDRPPFGRRNARLPSHGHPRGRIHESLRH